MYLPSDKELFHIHTYRCGHAEVVEDEAYVLKAIELGADRIVFTEHTPFPQNPFGNRMKYEELDEYIRTIRDLKEKFCDKIDVKCGLEIEYLPSYKNYYEFLREKLDVMMIGQHFYEVSKNKFSFELDKDELAEKEFICASLAINEGMETGLFDVVAHPDRIFRRRKKMWLSDMVLSSTNILHSAYKNNVILEINAASKNRKNQFRQEFWDIVNNDEIYKCRTINGLDAHCLKDLKFIDE